MIVDCHTHIDFSGEHADASQRLAAVQTVDKCIILAENSESSEHVNAALSDYIGRNGKKMFGFGVINPVTDNIGAKSLKTITEKLGLKGMVLYCSEAGFHPSHSRAMQFYEIAEEANIPVFFHNCGHLSSSAVLDFAQPYLIDEVARTYPGLKIIIGSMGVPFVEQTIAMVRKHQNVYADLTIQPNNIWQVYNTIVAAFERGVMGKLFFGSGFPHARADECIETLLGFNKLMGDTNLPTVPRVNIRNVIERNTLEVLGIE
ncbi:MAG: amidohydrolase family protein [Phycisphaerae bacterium]|nr:amidohydrolase family protein [Phycisphaerae bacterium]